MIHIKFAFFGNKSGVYFSEIAKPFFVALLLETEDNCIIFELMEKNYQRATIFHGFFLDANFPNSKIKLYGTIDEALLDLKTDRLDVVMSDGLQLLDGFLNKKEGKDYEFVGKVYTDPKWFGEGIGVVVHPDNKDLAHKFNEAIKSLREKGIYQKISKKWFGVDIYNVIDNP